MCPACGRICSNKTLLFLLFQVIRWPAYTASTGWRLQHGTVIKISGRVATVRITCKVRGGGMHVVDTSTSTHTDMEVRLITNRCVGISSAVVPSGIPPWKLPKCLFDKNRNHEKGKQIPLPRITIVQILRVLFDDENSPSFCLLLFQPDLVCGVFQWKFTSFRNADGNLQILSPLCLLVFDDV